MNRNDSPTDTDPLAVDLAAFIENHSALLVVMGVFAAVAVYISQSSPKLGTGTDAEIIYTIGFVSALGMTILLLLLVYKELASETGSWNHLHHAHYRLDNLPLALFTLFNGMLILSISYLITQYEPVIFILVLVATLFAGGGIFLRLLHEIGNVLPHSARVRIPMMFIVSLISVLVSDFVMKEYIASMGISTIYELSLSEPLPLFFAVTYILIGSIRAVAAIGVFASILSIPVVAFDKLRGKSPYDNPE